MKRLIVSALVATTALAAVPANAAPIYSNNYDAAATCAVTSCVFSAGGAFTAPLANVGGLSGNVLQNQTGGTPVGTAGGITSYTFTGVGGFSSFSLSFLLAFIDSWDSSNSG